MSKFYGGYTALDEISFNVPKGSVFGLLGPNGAGKTSLIRILNQIVLPDAGKVFLDGVELNPSHISQIGYLPEERGLYKSMKVGEQAMYLARLKGMSKTEAKERLFNVSMGEMVTVFDVSSEKYGRILCDLSTDTIPSIAQYMLKDPRLCRVYDGGKRTSWVEVIDVDSE